ncbi:hypothetical protein [Helicobacter pylori]|uniref:hypothetical protein n=1 Tax=Helicobacter pylori TaxID=210 RepID=UPI001FD0F4F2|nr:hypothetical protein [Helicobacter pylori]UOR75645.1 hypothetical protein MPG19_00640 [Helicobacter pylori]
MLELKLCKIPMIRDTERETLPQHQESQSSLAFGRFTSLHKRDYLKNQMTLGFQIPTRACLFVPQATNFFKG